MVRLMYPTESSDRAIRTRRGQAIGRKVRKMKIFGGGGSHINTGLASRQEDEVLVLNPMVLALEVKTDGVVVLDKENDEQMKRANAQLALMPGLELFTSGGRPGFNPISDRGNTSGRRRSAYGVGSWVLITSFTLPSGKVVEEAHGLVGDNMTSEGGFTAQAPTNSRAFGREAAKIVATVLPQAWGFTPGEVAFDVTGGQGVADLLHKYGMDESLPYLGHLRGCAFMRGNENAKPTATASTRTFLMEGKELDMTKKDSAKVDSRTQVESNFDDLDGDLEDDEAIPV